MSDEKKGQTMTPNSASGKTAPVERLDRQLKYEGAILKIYEDTVLVNMRQSGILSITTARRLWWRSRGRESF